jgi:hypothetical protein
VSFPWKIIEVDGLGYAAIEMFRAALSEETMIKRLQAIEFVGEDQTTHILSYLNDKFQVLRPNSNNADFISWVASTSFARTDAAFEVANLIQRYKGRERMLNVAEAVGDQIISSIQNNEFAGVGTPRGVFSRVCEEARACDIYGAKDHDTVREHWQTYKGVVHLGMALAYVEENPDQGFDVFQLAESYRSWLSENFPRKTKKPYVDSEVQISFVLKQ